MRRRERTDRTNCELFCISGTKFKSLMLEKDIVINSYGTLCI